MNRIISAVYEHGRIYPLEPLNINENQRLRVQIVPEILSDQSEHVIQFLIQGIQVVSDDPAVGKYK